MRENAKPKTTSRSNRHISRLCSAAEPKWWRADFKEIELLECFLLSSSSSTCHRYLKNSRTFPKLFWHFIISQNILSLDKCSCNRCVPADSAVRHFFDMFSTDMDKDAEDDVCNTAAQRTCTINLFFHINFQCSNYIGGKKGKICRDSVLSPFILFVSSNQAAGETTPHHKNIVPAQLIGSDERENFHFISKISIVNAGLWCGFLRGKEQRRLSGVVLQRRQQPHAAGIHHRPRKRRQRLHSHEPRQSGMQQSWMAVEVIP